MFVKQKWINSQPESAQIPSPIELIVKKVIICGWTRSIQKIACLSIIHTLHKFNKIQTTNQQNNVQAWWRLIISKLIIHDPLFRPFLRPFSIPLLFCILWNIPPKTVIHLFIMRDWSEIGDEFLTVLAELLTLTRSTSLCMLWRSHVEFEHNRFLNGVSLMLHDCQNGTYRNDKSE